MSQGQKSPIFRCKTVSEKQTKPAEYAPSNAEQKLLDVLMDPSNRMKSVTEICQLAGICRDTHYRAFARPEFVSLYKEMSLKVVRSAVAPVINAFVREAQRGSFQHGKILLEMADMYTEKSKKEVSGPDGGPVESTVTVRPQVTREEWLKLHGIGD